MAIKSKIEWTESSWNPITGCNKVSEGCLNCQTKTLNRINRGLKTFYL